MMRALRPDGARQWYAQSMFVMPLLHRQTPAPRAKEALRQRAALAAVPAPARAPVPAQEPADPRVDYIPVPPVGYDDEGYPVEDSVGQSQKHIDQTLDSYATVRDWCRRKGLGEVFSDLVMPYLRGQRNKVVCPDLMVSLRAERRDERTSYKLWENSTPDFVMEALSNSTWKADVRAKKRLYRHLGVSEYWLFDPAGKRLEERLRGYRLRRYTYRGRVLHLYGLVRPNRQGRWASEVLGLELCVREKGDMRLYDPAASEFLHSIEESYARAHALDDERQNAARERTARQAAEQRAQSADKRAESADKRAESAEQRARAAEARAKAAQEAADSRIAALEAQLRAQRQPD